MTQADVQGADAVPDRSSKAGSATVNRACGYEFHPLANLFPLMTEQELEELAADIRAKGLNEPIVLRDDKILDGRNRALACDKAGVRLKFQECPSNDPLGYVISANIQRRHLTAEQKRDLTADLLKAKPESSNREIAKRVKADDKTVAKVRRELEATAEIPQLEKTVGADGKARKKPEKKKRRTEDDFKRDIAAKKAAVSAPAPAETTREVVAADEKLDLLREFAQFVLERAAAVRVELKDRDQWNALRDRVKQVLGGDQ